MTALYISLSVIALIIFLFLMPVHVIILYDETLNLRFRYLFITKRIAPKKEEKISKEPTVEKVIEKKKKKKKFDIKSTIKEEGIGGFLSFVKKMIEIIFGSFKILIKHTIIKDISLNLLIAEEDAAKTAINYAHACSIIYNLANIVINSVRKCKNNNIIIRPDFLSGETKLKFKLHFNIKLIFILISLVKLGVRFVLNLPKGMRKPKLSGQNI